MDKDEWGREKLHEAAYLYAKRSGDQVEILNYDGREYVRDELIPPDDPDDSPRQR